jgi:hypothetical protein
MTNSVLVLVVLALGCGGHQPNTSPRSQTSHAVVYTIRIKSATISPRRPDGSPWHVTEADKSALIVGAAAGLAVGNPELGVKVAENFIVAGGDPQAPVPFVRVKLAGTTWTIGPVERSYAPAWNESFAINARELRGDEQVVIQVLDAVDESLIAQGQFTLEQLVSRPAQTLTNLQGSVPSLDVEATGQKWLEDVDVNNYGGGE